MFGRAVVAHDSAERAGLLAIGVLVARRLSAEQSVGIADVLLILMAGAVVECVARSVLPLAATLPASVDSYSCYYDRVQLLWESVSELAAACLHTFMGNATAASTPDAATTHASPSAPLRSEL